MRAVGRELVDAGAGGMDVVVRALPGSAQHGWASLSADMHDALDSGADAAMTRVLTFVWLLPRNICVAHPARLPRRDLPAVRRRLPVLPELLGVRARRDPAARRVKGIALGTWRIARCHPWAKGGVDDVPERQHPPSRPHASASSP